LIERPAGIEQHLHGFSRIRQDHMAGEDLMKTLRLTVEFCKRPRIDIYFSSLISGTLSPDV
jgi:hypothetical protein